MDLNIMRVFVKMIICIKITKISNLKQKYIGNEHRYEILATIKDTFRLTTAHNQTIDCEII